MSGVMYDLLYLFACGATGKTPVLNHSIEVEEIYKASISQSVWQTVFLAIDKVKDSEFISWGNLEYNQLKLYVMQSLMINERKLYNIHKFIEKLQENNIKATVLKGETLSLLYDNPSCRISSDADILIDKRYERRACRVARKLKMESQTRNYFSPHAILKSEKTGVIELHIQLYEEVFEELWFDKKMANCEETRKIKTADGFTLNTLGITDGAIFVSLHLIKHFLEKGVGIRQMMDTLIYLKSYKKEINFKRYNSLMKHLKYDKFMDNIIGIGIEYFNFDKDDLPICQYDTTMMDKILTDTFKGGTFGLNGAVGVDFYKIYSKKRAENFKNINYESYMKKINLKNSLKMLFPNHTLLKAKYKYVEKHKWLVPVAWLHRFVRKILGTQVVIEDEIVNNEAIEERLNFINDLKMI